MEKLARFRKEILVISYYVIFVTAICTIDFFAPTHGAHSPGLSFLLALLFIPTTLVYFIIQLFRLGRNRNCIFIHLAVWVVLFFVLMY